MTRNPDNIDDGQKDQYHVGSLTLNLGRINRQPYIGFRT